MWRRLDGHHMSDATKIVLLTIAFAGLVVLGLVVNSALA